MNPLQTRAAQRLVDRLHWMSNDVYAEIFALAQCIPGPASTQVSFAVGIIKKGVSGERGRVRAGSASFALGWASWADGVRCGVRRWHHQTGRLG